MYSHLSPEVLDRKPRPPLPTPPNIQILREDQLPNGTIRQANLALLIPFIAGTVISIGAVCYLISK